MRQCRAACFVALALVACTSVQKAGWKADEWLRQEERDVSANRWTFSASPMASDGFKLKLTLKTDGFFRPARAPQIPASDVVRSAAERAAPEGCQLTDLDMMPDGSAVASYDCT